MPVAGSRSPAGRTPDTSVVVAALASWHPRNAEARQALSGVRTVTSPVLLETYSVLTRLPAPHRISPADAAAAVKLLPWEVVGLPAPAQQRLVQSAAAGGIAGGAVYDALVATTAAHHGLTLLTRDARARRTYDALGVGYAIV